MHFAGITNIDELLKNAGEDVETSDFEMPTTMRPEVRKKLNKAIAPYTTGSESNNTYFKIVPLDNFFEVLEAHGYVPLQEDNTYWSGGLFGEEGRANIELGVKYSVDTNGFFKPVTNAMLVINWTKIPSGKYEITAYIS